MLRNTSRWWQNIVLGASLLVVASSGALSATLGDCATVGNAMVRGYPVAPFGLPLPPTSPPRPSNPSEKSCEDGRIIVQVEADRSYGHRIMDLVRVTVMVSAAPEVMLDFQSLARGIISFDGQEFDLAVPAALANDEAPATVQMMRAENGRMLYKIELILQSSVPQTVAPYLVFRMDIRYSLESLRDTNGVQIAARDWRVLTTAPIGLTMSRTAAPDDQLMVSAPSPATHLKPWPTWSLLVAGIFLVLFWPGLALVRWLNRIRPGRVIPANELAWRRMAPVFAAAEKSGYFEPHHYRVIASAVREYLGMPGATVLELRTMLENHPQSAQILRVIYACEAVVYGDEVVAPHYRQLLVLDVQAIVPRPR